MTKNRMKDRAGWMSTSLTIASGAAAATEMDLRGWQAMKLILPQALNPVAHIGIKARPNGYSTSRIVWDSETGSGQPAQIAINTTGRVYDIPARLLRGLSFVTLYTKNTTAANTAVVNQTGGAKTIYVEGVRASA